MSCENDDFEIRDVNPTEIIIVYDTVVIETTNNDPIISVTGTNTVGNRQFMNLHFLGLKGQFIELIFRPVSGDCVLDSAPTAPDGAVIWSGDFVYTSNTQLFFDEPVVGGGTLLLTPDSDDSEIQVEFRLTGLDSNCGYEVDIVCNNGVVDTVYYPN